MKTLKTNFFILLSIIFITISCDSYIEGLNEDPNAPTDSDVKNMFQGILLSSQFYQTSSTARLNMIWMNQATGADRQYVALNNWNNITAGDFTNDWGVIYSNTIANAKIIEEKAMVENKIHYAGAAKVMRALALGTATSLWGDVPATEAADYENYPNPSYDAQADVYSMVQSLLDDAIDLLSQSSPVSLEKDIIYDGDISKWIKMAHSVKARFYLHVKDYANAKAEADLGISNASEDYRAKFGDSYRQSFNPFFSFYIYDRDGYMNADDAYAPNLLDENGSHYRGNSKTDEVLRFNYNYYSDGVYELDWIPTFWYGYEGKFGAESNTPILTYGEMLLIKAEYEARTNGLSAGVNAYNEYRALLSTGYSIGNNNDGFADAFGGNYANGMYQDYADNDFNNGGIENADNKTPFEAFLRELYEERYVYFIGNFESFTDFRRTHNIAEIQLKPGFDNTPQRFLYPQSEVNSNSNVPSPIPSISDRTAVNN